MCDGQTRSECQLGARSGNEKAQNNFKFNLFVEFYEMKYPIVRNRSIGRRRDNVRNLLDTNINKTPYFLLTLPRY
eukprot:scaffold1807_cov140-Cylindrotheca_fusiformis.AAC.12